MERAYLNHSRLIFLPVTQVSTAILNICRCKDILKSTPLYVYEGFWNIPIQGGTLRSLLTRIDNRDYSYALILGLMHNGPYFHESTPIENLIIKPEVEKDCFAEKLLHICFNDMQPHVLSLPNERDLPSSKYMLEAMEQELELTNFIGEDNLLEYFKEKIVFDAIEDVFLEIKKSSSSIVILSSAEKSARKHNFKGAFADVFKTIMALPLEMKRIEEGVSDRQRADLFKQETGFDISPEDSLLKSNHKFSRHRMFSIPSQGSHYFE